MPPTDYHAGRSVAREPEEPVRDRTPLAHLGTGIPLKPPPHLRQATLGPNSRIAWVFRPLPMPR